MSKLQINEKFNIKNEIIQKPENMSEFLILSKMTKNIMVDIEILDLIKKISVCKSYNI